MLYGFLPIENDPDLLLKGCSLDARSCSTGLQVCDHASECCLKNCTPLLRVVVPFGPYHVLLHPLALDILWSSVVDDGPRLTLLDEEHAIPASQLTSS